MFLRCLLTFFAALPLTAAFAQEYNPVRTHPMRLGPQASRFIVGFRATSRNAQTLAFHARSTHLMQITRAHTSREDVEALLSRTQVAAAGSRQITPDMHVIFAGRMLYGEAVLSALAALRADEAVEFADIDERRYPTNAPNDPLFGPTTGATGQWYLLAPSAAGGTLANRSAVDAVDAWDTTVGDATTVIAEIDTGVRFEHPDLLRAGFGGRLLPGYDFVNHDSSANTFLTANDGDGWDPDPSDPGDWVNSTDQKSKLFDDCDIDDSSWHGTRVAGILGALTDNAVGVAGLTWGSYILPVRALGKCGGYDSDIIAAVEWAAGMNVSPSVPDNPFPADVINLSLGSGTSCSTAYRSAFDAVNRLGAVVVVAAGNESGPVDSPGNCSALVPGVIAVAGLRHSGTKVGYSSFGPEVGIAAPAGNCINASGACLRSIDTTSNSGLTAPASSIYTNQTAINIGTSFSSPIVAGIAALMHSANQRLTPAQIVARLEASAAPFPANTGLPVCPAVTNDNTSHGECSCPPSGQCGFGMANAKNAVAAALEPIAAVAFPATYSAGSAVTFDAAASAAACSAEISGYSWSAGSGLVVMNGGGTEPNITVTGTGTLTLTVTDSNGATDIARISVGATSSSTTAPAGTNADACTSAINVAVAAPTTAVAFSPDTVAAGSISQLTLTVLNSNAFALTQASVSADLPSGLAFAASPAASTTCGGAQSQLSADSGRLTLTNAVVPANSACTVSVNVSATSVGTYPQTLAAAAVTTAPAGNNADGPSALLTVTPATKKGGGGALGWVDLSALALLAAALCRARSVRGII